MANAFDETEQEGQTAVAEPAKPESGDGDQRSPQPPAAVQRPQIDVDDSKAVTSYSNFCRVTGTPEELIIDFGLNPQPMGLPNRPIVITQRIILNPYTTKRLLAVLHMSIQRHEGVFGVLETDVQKRVHPGGRAAG